MKPAIQTILVVLFFICCSFTSYSQNEKITASGEKDPIGIFNEKRTGLTPSTTIEFNIRALKSDNGQLSALVNLLDKLDYKIVHLSCDLSKNNITIGFSNSIQLLDILQVLNKHGYPATFITDDGKKASLNAYGEIEYWNIK